MKKLLLLILVGFILTSIIALSFTFQASNSFNEFEGDDNAGDDEMDMENSLLEKIITRVLIKPLSQKRVNFLSLIEKNTQVSRNNLIKISKIMLFYFLL